MIEVKGVTKSFDDFTALDNVTCNIAEGCIYGMVGSNIPINVFFPVQSYTK